jgi:hypothetical protein
MEARRSSVSERSKSPLDPELPKVIEKATASMLPVEMNVLFIYPLQKRLQSILRMIA